MKSINWKDHLINLLVVVIGITAAFYLESWKESNSDDRLEAKYLQSLSEDLQQDLGYIDTLRSIDQTQINALKRLTAATIGPDYSEDSLLYYIRFIQFSVNFTPQSVTYESMKFSGKLDIIEDFEFRNRIVGLYEQYYRAVREIDGAVAHYVENFVQPYSIEHIVLSYDRVISREFLSDYRFKNIIFPLRGLMIRRLEFYEELRQEVQEIKAQLDPESE